MGVSRARNKCASVGIQGIAWAFGGTIFALVYCIAGVTCNGISSIGCWTNHFAALKTKLGILKLHMTVR
ncbi:hypothetical protein DVH24_014248 [Malus domestica]|uniref:Uncharacterized protein n=1 Tax=Malus domestica TaxID=3750 RepID=A0A498JIZ2_MALDO|nr:hypothetical protein DVH24_014248 [Malus domestica]